MLQITTKPVELFDDETNTFIIPTTKPQTLQLEHSLVSLSKWESKWVKPFLTNSNKTDEETIDYIRCMTITQNVDPEIYKDVTKENIDAVSLYINLPMTATTFAKDEKRVINREIITAEIIYYWMIALQIPFECQKWHLNRLLTLINVCNIKNQPAKKMSKKELLSRNRSLNESRKAALNTTG
jgi:hypothetical protein